MIATKKTEGYSERSDNKLRRITLFLASAGLLLAVAFQCLRNPRNYGTASHSGLLGSRLPTTVFGWAVRDEALGDTEAMKVQVKEILNYDDFVYRRYISAGKDFAVYAAHWAPGRMPTRLVTLHTPDRCWIENGWTCQMAEFNTSLIIPGLKFPPAQRREFIPPNSPHRVFVSFWLTVDGEIYDLGRRMNTVPSPVDWIEQVIRESFKEDGEQLFVRITSDRPLEQFIGDEGFAQVMAAVSKLLSPRAEAR